MHPLRRGREFRSCGPSRRERELREEGEERNIDRGEDARITGWKALPAEFALQTEYLDDFFINLRVRVELIQFDLKLTRISSVDVPLATAFFRCDQVSSTQALRSAEQA